MSNAIDQYGQTAVDATLFIVRIDLVKDLVTSFLLLLIFAGFLVLMVRAKKDLIEKPLRKPTNDDDVGETQKDRDSEVCCLIGLTWAFAVFFALFTMFSPINKIFNPWTYIGIAKPELWIAKQVYDKALNTVVDVKK